MRRKFIYNAIIFIVFAQMHLYCLTSPTNRSVVFDDSFGNLWRFSTTTTSNCQPTQDRAFIGSSAIACFVNEFELAVVSVNGGGEEEEGGKSRRIINQNEETTLQMFCALSSDDHATIEISVGMKSTTPLQLQSPPTPKSAVMISRVFDVNFSWNRLDFSILIPPNIVLDKIVVTSKSSSSSGSNNSTLFLDEISIFQTGLLFIYLFIYFHTT